MQKQSLQTPFGPKVHFSGIEETREVGRSNRHSTKSKERGNRTLRTTGEERENQRLKENSLMYHTFFWGCM